MMGRMSEERGNGTGEGQGIEHAKGELTESRGQKGDMGGGFGFGCQSSGSQDARGREHYGVPDDSADRLAMPYDMRTPGPRQTLSTFPPGDAGPRQ